MSKTWQYPHALYILTIGEATQDKKTGDWVKAADSWSLSSYCRAETNGKANQVSNADGKVIVYSDTVYLPAKALSLTEGQQIAVLTEEIEDESKLSKADYISQLRRDGKLKAYGQVFKYDAGRLHGRIWL